MDSEIRADDPTYLAAGNKSDDAGKYGFLKAP